MAKVVALAWLVASSVWSQWSFPRAVPAGEAAVNMLECTLGAHTAWTFCGWELPAGVHWDATAVEVCTPRCLD